MADLYYIESGYLTPDEGYYTYVADAASSQTATATMTCSAGKIQSAASTLTVAASQSVIPSKTVGAVINIDGAFSSTMTVNARRTTEIQLISQFTEYALAVAKKSANITLDNIVALSSQSQRLRDTTSSLDTTATQTATAYRIKQFASTQTVSATQTTDNTRTRSFASALSTTASISVSVVATRTTASTQSAEFTQSATAKRYRGISSTQSATFTQSTSRYFGTGRPKNLSGSVTWDTATYKFGTASLKGTGSLTSSTYSSTRPKANEDWVVEGWFYPVNQNQATGSVDFGWINFGWYSISSGSTILPTASIFNSSGINTDLTGSTTLSTSTFNHIAVVKNSTRMSLYLNGTRVATTTSLLTSYRSASTITLTPNTQNNQNARIDEVSVWTGTTLGYDPSSTTITVPTTARSNDPYDTRVLYHLDSNGNDDIAVGNITGSASISSTATLTSSVSVVKIVNASLSSTAALTSSVSRTIQFTATVSATATVDATAKVRKEFGSSSLLVTATMTTIPANPKNFAAELTASSSLSSSIDKIKSLQASLSTISEISISASRIRGINSALTINAILTAIATKTKGTSSSMSTLASLTADANVSEATWNTRTWMRGLRTTTDSIYNRLTPSGLAINETNSELYEIFEYRNSSTNQVGFEFTVRNTTSGAITSKKLWQFEYGGVQNEIFKITNLAWDGTYCYFGVSNNSGTYGTYRNRLIKYNPATQTIVWSVVTKMSAIERVIVNSGYVYAIGNTSITGPYTVWALQKLDTDGVDQASLRSNSANDTWITGAEIAGGYLWVSSSNQTSSTVILKHSLTDFAISDWRSVSRVAAINKDSADNLYLIGNGYPTGTAAGEITKFDSSWTVTTDNKFQWLNGASWQGIDFDQIVWASTGEAYVKTGYNTAATIMRIPSTLDSITWINRMDDDAGLGDAFGDPQYFPVDIAVDSGQRVYWQGVNTAPTNYDLTIIGRVLKSTGGPLQTNIPYRDGVTTSDNLWTYTVWTTSTRIQSGTTTFTGGGSYAVGSASSPSGAVTISEITDQTVSDYIYIATVTAYGGFTATASQTAVIGKILGTSSSQSVTASIAITATKITRAASTLSTTATLTAVVNRKASGQSSQSAAFTQTTVNRRLRDLVSTQSATFTQTTSARKITGAVSTQSATFTETATTTDSKITRISAVLAVGVSELTVAVKRTEEIVLVSGTASLTATVRKIVDRPIALTVTATQTATAKKTVRTTSTQSATVSLTANISKYRLGQSAMAVTAAMTTVAVKITRTSSTESVTASLTAVNGRLRGITGSLSTTVAISARPQYVKSGQAQLSAEFTKLFVITRIVRAQADIQAQVFTLTVGEVLNIDPYLTLQIEPETRGLIITQETREITIESETRVNII